MGPTAGPTQDIPTTLLLTTVPTPTRGRPAGNAPHHGDRYLDGRYFKEMPTAANSPWRTIPTGEDAGFAQSLSVARQKMVHARGGADNQPFLDTLAMNQKLYNNVEAGMDPICVARGEARDNVVSTAEFLYQYSCMQACGFSQPALFLLLMLL